MRVEIEHSLKPHAKDFNELLDKIIECTKSVYSTVEDEKIALSKVVWPSLNAAINTAFETGKKMYKSDEKDDVMYELVEPIVEVPVEEEVELEEAA